MNNAKAMEPIVIGYKLGTACEECSAKHRNWRSFIRCAWPGAELLNGCPIEQRCWAVVSHCWPTLREYPPPCGAV